jgi:hypothetical protein
MLKFEKLLTLAGVLSFAVALFQALIEFSPSLSLYFGAPEALVKNVYALIMVSFLIAGILAGFGIYAISGAGHIRTLPLLNQVLIVTSIIYILRGLLVVPELIVVFGIIDVSIPVAPRFVLFSLGSLFIGLVYLTGTIGGWNKFP